MSVQIDITNLLIGFALLMLAFWGGNAVVGAWKGRRRRRKFLKRPEGYAGAVPMDYRGHPDAEVERSKGGEGL